MSCGDGGEATGAMCLCTGMEGGREGAYCKRAQWPTHSIPPACQHSLRLLRMENPLPARGGPPPPAPHPRHGTPPRPPSSPLHPSLPPPPLQAAQAGPTFGFMRCGEAQGSHSKRANSASSAMCAMVAASSEPRACTAGRRRVQGQAQVCQSSSPTAHTRQESSKQRGGEGLGASSCKAA
jgi:hypothetical protein